MNTITTPVSAAQIDLGIGGMTCASCVSRVEQALKKQAGVTEATVNLATESARVPWSTVTTPESLARIKRAVRDAGYEPRAMEAMDAAADETLDGRSVDLLPVLIGIVLSAPLALPMVGDLFGKHWMLPGWVQFLLATPVQFCAGCALLPGGLARAQGADRQHGVAGGHRHHGGLGAVDLAVAGVRSRARWCTCTSKARRW